MSKKRIYETIEQIEKKIEKKKDDHICELFK
jgi:hypothetical protein